jgi:hypothetical protein
MSWSAHRPTPVASYLGPLARGGAADLSIPPQLSPFSSVLLTLLRSSDLLPPPILPHLRYLLCSCHPPEPRDPAQCPSPPRWSDRALTTPPVARPGSPSCTTLHPRRRRRGFFPAPRSGWQDPTGGCCRSNRPCCHHRHRHRCRRHEGWLARLRRAPRQQGRGFRHRDDGPPRCAAHPPDPNPRPGHPAVRSARQGKAQLTTARSRTCHL